MEETKLIVFSGGSDDLIHYAIEGKEEQEINVISDDLIIASFIVGGKLRVYAIYDGVWMFAAGKADEDLDITGWEIKIKDSDINGYTMELHILCPASCATVFREELKR